MQITRNTLQTDRGPGDWFTGDVYLDTITAPVADPLGQTIWVTEGVGLCQREGGPIEVIRPGDRVFFEPGESHWDGAGPTRLMTHIAIQQADEQGNIATWGDHVTDDEYAAALPIDGRKRPSLRTSRGPGRSFSAAGPRTSSVGDG